MNIVRKDLCNSIDIFFKGFFYIFSDSLSQSSTKLLYVSASASRSKYFHCISSEFLRDWHDDIIIRTGQSSHRDLLQYDDFGPEDQS